MTTYNTGNPIGSTDARDRLDNSENMDILENSTTLNAHADRLGTMRKTRKGMELEHDNQISSHEAEHDAQISAHEAEHDNQMQSFENDFDSRLAGMAFTRVGTFTTGATLTDMRQTLLWEASQGGDGHEYGWSGSFPKVVAAGSTPATSGGIGDGEWVDRTDLTLRDELINLRIFFKVSSDHPNLDTFISSLNTTNSVGIIDTDYTLTSPLLIENSIDISGAMNGKSNFTEITNNTTSAIVSTKDFSSIDENITYQNLSKLSVKSSAVNAGTSGFQFERNNVHTSLTESKATGYEKGLRLIGCIGFSGHRLELTENKYGLYTETSVIGGLSTYDTTNSSFYDITLANNETGAYLGAITQGVNFFGGNIERNTVSGVDIATTFPAGGVINFNGTWFEGNPIAARFITRPTTVSFNSCTFYANTELFSNNGSGNIDAEFNRCKIEGSHINLNIFNGTFTKNFCYNCTFTADSPAAYQQQNWSGTSVTVSDGNTLLSSRAIGNGRYAVEAIGAPTSAATLSDGSTWLDVSTAIKYILVSSVWKREFSYLSIDKTIDVPSLAVGGSYVYGPFTLTGVTTGSFIEIASSINMQGVSVTGISTALNSVTITFYNNSEAVVDLSSATYRIKAST